MTLHIIVPVKRLAEAKGRLAPALAEAQRQLVAQRLLRHVLSVVQQAQEQLGAAGVVVSPDPDVLALAAVHTLTPLLEDRACRLAAAQLASGERADPSLNAALEQATAFAASRGAHAVLILPADLPLLTLADVEALWQASQQLHVASVVIIAPDSRDAGTNALLVRPPGALRFQFGPGSFQRHCEQARQRGLACVIHRSARLGLDVDTAADLDLSLGALSPVDEELSPRGVLCP